MDDKLHIDVLFAKFDKIWFKPQQRFYMFKSCVQNINIESKDIPKLITYFEQDSILNAIQLIPKTTISSSILVDILKVCLPKNRYNVLEELIPYVNSFDSFDHKAQIIEMLAYQLIDMDYVITLIENKPINKKFMEENKNDPPPYGEYSKYNNEKCSCVLL
jgi:hypothetical protein